MRFFEDRDGEGPSTCAIDIDKRPFYLRQNFKDDNEAVVDCKNDHAKSAVLENLPAGTVILLYSSPHCNTDEDWTRLDIRMEFPRIGVWEFNLDEDWIVYKKTSHDGTNDRSAGILKHDPKRYVGGKDVGQGGVGGAVSCIIIDVPGRPAQAIRKPVAAPVPAK